MSARVGEATARSVRGLGQGGVGWTIVECIEAFELYDFTERQYGLAVFVLGALVSFLQNTLESRGIIPAVLRNVPPTTAPLVDTTGGLDPESEDYEMAERIRVAVEDDDDNTPLEEIGEDVHDDLTDLGWDKV